VAIVTLRPDSTIQSGLWTREGPSYHEVLSDDDDNTYARALETIDSNQAELRLGLQDLGIVANLPIRAIRTRVRARSVATQQTPAIILKVGTLHPDAVSSRFDEFVVSMNTTSTQTGPWYQSTPNGQSYTHEMVNAMVQTLRATGASGQNELNVLETYLDVEYFEPPSATIVSPTGTINVTSPTIDWDFECPQWFEQLGYEAEILEGSTVIWSSGVVKSRVTQFNLPTHLLNGSYTLRLRVKSNWGGSTELWSDWEEQAFTVDAPVPPAPILSVSPDHELGLIGLTIEHGIGDNEAEEFLVQRAESSDGPWRDLTGSPYGADVGLVLYPGTETYPGYSTFPGSGIEIVLVVDYTPVPKREMFYRVRGVRSDGTLVGPASDIKSTTVELKKWILKNLFIESMEYIYLDIEQQELDIESGEDKAAFNPLGQVGDRRKTNKIVVKDSIRGDKFPLTMGFIGNESYDEFVEMRDSQRVLFLQAPMPNGAWFMTFDSPVRYKVKNMNDPIYRQVQVDVIEVDSVPS